MSALAWAKKTQAGELQGNVLLLSEEIKDKFQDAPVDKPKQQNLCSHMK